MKLPDLKNTKDMLLCGVFASEAVDSSGEIVKIDGIDISSLEEGTGTANVEHVSLTDGLGKETVGKIVYVKKIFTISDCDDDVQREFLKETRGRPFLFGVVRLFDGAGHHEAKDLAAQIRDYQAHGEKCLVRFSIEGSTVIKEGNVIKESIARRVALTIQPANRTALSRMVADPNAPDGFEKVDEISLLKAELFQDPQYKKIGGATVSEAVVLNEVQTDQVKRLIKNITILKAMNKALDAGCSEGAPSTLTGGAALQREDFSPKLYSGTVFAAARDYDAPWSREGFKKHLKERLSKANLPEMSEAFLDHFTDAAEAWKLKKSVDECFSDLQKKEGKAVLASPDESVIEDLDDEDKPAIPGKTQKAITVATFRGKKLRPNPTQKGVDLDVKKGVLRTPLGTFKLHNPATEAPEVTQHFMDLLNSPHTDKIMSKAMEGWEKVHKLNKAGELPEEIPMTATILSTCSGNRPVPLTELQTVRIVDAMRNSGIDVRKPGFENILPHLRDLDKPDVLPVTGGEAIGSDPAYYLGNKIGVDRDQFGNKLGKPSTSQGKSGSGPKTVSDNPRYPGELKTINPLLEETIKNLSQYYKAHRGLVELVQKHRHDMAGAVRELMASKQARVNWENRRKKILAETGKDPGEYKGLNIPGIKLKTGLYAYGMMGGGSSVVPDTHFIRHMFGLDSHKDSDTLKYLKKVFWTPSNYHLIDKYNEWYRKNHPAFTWMVNHPKFGKMFEKPEDATFPAFWANWMNIPLYEQKLGTSYAKQANNTGSTHAPYWAAIEPHVNQAMERLGKSEDFDSTAPLRAALVMQHYVKDYGEIPAQMMYYTHLVPKLLESAHNRQMASDARRFLKSARQMEAGLIELRKAMRHVTEGGHSVEMPEVYSVEVHENGKPYHAGRFMTIHGNLHHLEDYHGLLESMVPEGPITADTISKIHGLQFSPHFSVTEQPLSLANEDEGPKPTPALSIAREPTPPRPAVFSYFRPGMVKPHVVEFMPNGKAALDGKALTHQEVVLMLQNARKGLAMVKWHNGEGLAKSLEGDEDWAQQDQALQHIRAAEAAGHLPPGTAKHMTRGLYEDTMVKGMGNKRAAQQFRSQNRPGVYASFDANEFKSINDRFGHDAGDAAIATLGGALRAAADKVGNIKMFRSGGDEFYAHAPTHEDMAQLLHHVREHVEKLPPIVHPEIGTHKHSISVGVGHTFGHADKALELAKKGKFDPVTKQRLHPVGNVPILGFSLYPGHEGQLFKQDPTLPKATTQLTSPAPLPATG